MTTAKTARRNLVGNVPFPSLNWPEHWFAEKTRDGALTVNTDQLPSDIPGTARVFVITHLRLRGQVFDCGTVSQRHSPTCLKTNSDQMMLGGKELEVGSIEIRIVDRHDHRKCVGRGKYSRSTTSILGQGAGGEGLGIRISEQLGGQAFKMNFDESASEPVVEVNSSNSALFEALISPGMSEVKATILPQLIESVLDHLILDHLSGLTDANKASSNWKGLWLNSSLFNQHPLPDRDERDLGNTELQELNTYCLEWKEEIMKETVKGKLLRFRSQSDLISSWPRTSEEE